MAQLEWKAPDTEGLVEFLCRDKGFKWVPPFHRFVVPLFAVRGSGLYDTAL
jgi:hypothetical protein